MMDARCIVNAGEFQKALEKVLKVAPKKCSIPALMEVVNGKIKYTNFRH